MPSILSGDEARFDGRTAFLFDLDGTLVDSSPLHAAAFRTALREHAPELAARFEYASIAGLDSVSAAHALGVAGDLVSVVVSRKQALYRDSVARGELRAFPMAGELLTHLRSRGARLALVTSASRASALVALSAVGLDRFFEPRWVVARDEAAHGKPHPALHERALSLLGVERGDAIAIEDAPSGVAACLAAKLSVVLVHGLAGDASIPWFPDLGALHRAIVGASP